MTEDDTPPDVGSLGEEAARLVEALAHWAGERGDDVGEAVADAADSVASAARDVDQHVATGAQECRYCPICRIVHAVRETNPEVKAHLATAAHSLLAAAASILATSMPDQPTAEGFERIRVDEPGDEDHHP